MDRTENHVSKSSLSKLPELSALPEEEEEQVTDQKSKKMHVFVKFAIQSKANLKDYEQNFFFKKNFWSVSHFSMNGQISNRKI